MSKTIMLVDDEPHMIALEKAVLEGADYKIICAENGETALKMLEKETPDLIILDMMMPGMSGREVCDKLRKNPKTKDIKVIFVTVAKFSEVGKINLKELNVLEYITKPFENEDLVKSIKKALSEKI